MSEESGGNENAPSMKDHRSVQEPNPYSRTQDVRHDKPDDPEEQKQMEWKGWQPGTDDTDLPMSEMGFDNNPDRRNQVPKTIGQELDQRNRDRSISNHLRALRDRLRLRNN